MRVEDSSFRKNETGTSCILYAEGITKTRQSGLHQKSRLQLPKMFERCPVKLFQKYLSKCPVGTQKSGSLYLEPFVNPLTSLWFTRHLWESTISILWWKIWYQTRLFRKVKNTWQTILQEKHLEKKFKQQQVPKPEITSITGHNREAGLDAYDSSDEMQQKQLSHFIDNHQPTASRNKYSISPNNPIIRNKMFSFFPNDDQFYQNISASNFFSFHNCAVHFHMNNQVQDVSASVKNPEKPWRIIYSRDSSQEK